MFSSSVVFLYVLYSAFPGPTVAHRFWVFDYRPCSYPISTQVPGFNINRFLGRWYMLEKFRSSFEGNDGPVRHMDECGRFEFFPSGSGGVNTYIAWEIHSNIRSPQIRMYCGYIQQRNVSRPEEISYLTYGLDFPFQYYFTVVDTDYTSYAVLSSCYSTIARQTWILTRAQGVAPSNLDAIKANLAAQGVETGRLTRVGQEDCKAQAEYDLEYNHNHYCQNIDSLRDTSVGL